MCLLLNLGWNEIECKLYISLLNFPEDSDTCHEGYKNYLKTLEHGHGESSASDDSGLSEDSNSDDSDSESPEEPNLDDQEPKEPNLDNQDPKDRFPDETVDDQYPKGNTTMLGLPS
jgi:hypothetical protein